MEQNRTEAERWQNKAREALAAGREDLARRALRRKREHEDLVRGLETQHAAAGQTCTNVRTSLRALEARLAEARRKQRSLLARHRAALAQAELHRALGPGLPDLGTPGAKFERLENRLLDLEDELAARVELQGAWGRLEEEFAELESEHEMDRELEALKRSTT